MSDLRLPVDVEPPSDARWDRIGRELFAKLDAAPPAERPVAREHAWSRRGPRWTGAAAFAIAAAAVIFAVRSKHPATADHKARLETADGASEFTVGESSLRVAPWSLVMVSGDDERGVDVVLDRGEVTCSVAPRKGRPAFVVDAGDVQVRVVGTRFTVARQGGGASVAVEHGVVEVVAHGAVVSLHDGDRWPRLSASPPLVTEGALSAAPGPSADAPLPVAAPPHTAGSLVRDPSAAARESLALRSVSAASGSGGTRTGAPQASQSPQASAPPTAQEQFETGTRIERTRPDDAMAAYRQVAAGGSAWAPNALFALARLEAERGRSADATRHLDEYLDRYPRGINADDARLLLQRMR